MKTLATDPAFQRLLDQARAVLAFTLLHTVQWGDEDDRSIELRVADFVAWRGGYTATTEPAYERVVDALVSALEHETRSDHAASRVDQAPEFTP